MKVVSNDVRNARLALPDSLNLHLLIQIRLLLFTTLALRPPIRVLLPVAKHEVLDVLEELELGLAECVFLSGQKLHGALLVFALQLIQVQPRVDVR